MRVHTVETGADKAQYVAGLGSDRCVAIGNGANDASMLELAALGIAVLGPEGAAAPRSPPPTSSAGRLSTRSPSSSTNEHCKRPFGRSAGARARASNRRGMARRKKRRPLRPRVPARVKKRTTRIRSHHETELIGLALTALGLVLSAILYLGLDGGAVGSWLADALALSWERPRTCCRLRSSQSAGSCSHAAICSRCDHSGWASVSDSSG